MDFDSVAVFEGRLVELEFPQEYVDTMKSLGWSCKIDSLQAEPPRRFSIPGWGDHQDIGFAGALQSASFEAGLF